MLNTPSHVSYFVIVFISLLIIQYAEVLKAKGGFCG